MIFYLNLKQYNNVSLIIKVELKTLKGTYQYKLKVSTSNNVPTSTRTQNLHH